MARGRPDWDFKADTILPNRVTDLQELSDRLTSPHYFDPRGRAIFIDQFEESPAKGELDASGGSVTKNEEYSMTGSYSCKISSGVGTASYGGFKYVVELLNPKKIGLQASISLDSEPGYIDYRLMIYDGTLKHWPIIRVDFIADEIQYYSDTQAWVKITDLTGWSGWSSQFQTLKFVIDYVNKKYLRMMHQGVEYDLSGISYYTSSLSARAKMMPAIRAYGISGGAGIVYLDSVIVTIDEL